MAKLVFSLSEQLRCSILLQKCGFIFLNFRPLSESNSCQCSTALRNNEGLKWSGKVLIACRLEIWPGVKINIAFKKRRKKRQFNGQHGTTLLCLAKVDTQKTTQQNAVIYYLGYSLWAGSRWTAAPWRWWGRGSSCPSGCPDRSRPDCWCCSDRSSFEMWPADASVRQFRGVEDETQNVREHKKEMKLVWKGLIPL